MFDLMGSLPSLLFVNVQPRRRAGEVTNLPRPSARWRTRRTDLLAACIQGGGTVCSGRRLSAAPGQGHRSCFPAAGPRVPGLLSSLRQSVRAAVSRKG